MSDNKIQKVSIRFFNDREVRAVWDETLSEWWFSVLDVVGVLNNQDDYTKNRNYWKYLKTKLKKENNELVSVTNHFDVIFLQLSFQILPVVSVLRIIILRIQHPDNIKHTIPPLGILLIPNSPDLPVIEETD